MAISTFSETWHRVADARVGLLPTVQVHKQRFRGQDWYVLQDSCSQRFFRVTSKAYSFIARLTPNQTIGEIWIAFLETHPEDAPGQEEVTQVLAQLHHANLLYFRSRPDSAAIFERYREFRQRELLGKLLGFLYVRIPLWDPNDWLDRTRPLIHALSGKFVFIAWLLVMLLGGIAVIENLDLVFSRSQGLLAMENLIWLYLCMAVLKSLHELAHAFVCKRFGGNVHTMGIMFLVFAPLPYIDATGSWTFRDRKARALVGASGIFVELFMAALGAVIWAGTAPGLINSLAFNVMIIGSISSLLFNGNVLLRFDAYYVLSDLIDVPNLYQKASAQWLYFADRYLLGTPYAKSPAGDKREWCWLTAYGFLAFFYRLFIVMAILLFVGDKWPGVAIIFLTSTLIMMVVMPCRKLYSHLTGPRVQRNRKRAVAAVIMLLALPTAAGTLIPLPYGIKMPGVVEAQQKTIIHAGVSGCLQEVFVRSGDAVAAQEPIALLYNPELELDLDIVRYQIREAEAMYVQAIGSFPGDIEPLATRLEALRQREKELQDRVDQLLVRAPHAGKWVGPPLNDLLDGWVGKGAEFGEVVDHSNLWFTAVVSQSQADELFSEEFSHGELRLVGQAEKVLASGSLQLLPYQRQELPSPVLGWAGGGQVAVDPKDTGGGKAVESFYVLRLRLEESQSAVLYDGMSGWARVSLDYKPLHQQVGRALRQLLQKRYQL